MKLSRRALFGSLAAVAAPFPVEPAVELAQTYRRGPVGLPSEGLPGLISRFDASDPSTFEVREQRIVAIWNKA